MSSPPLKRSRSLDRPHDSFEYTRFIQWEPSLDNATDGQLYLIVGVAPRVFQDKISQGGIPFSLQDNEVKLPGTSQLNRFEGYIFENIYIKDCGSKKELFDREISLDLTSRLDISQVPSANGFSIITQLVRVVTYANMTQRDYGELRVKHIRFNPVNQN